MSYRPADILFGNFKVYEALNSWTANRLGIHNMPNDKVIIQAKLTAKYILQPVRDHFKIPYSPSSFIRVEALEKVVARNGFLRWLKKHAEYSPEEFSQAWPEYFSTKQHPKGEAVDIKLPGIPTVELFTWIKENLEYDQLICEGCVSGDPYSGVVHVSYSQNENRNQVISNYEMG